MRDYVCFWSNRELSDNKVLDWKLSKPGFTLFHKIINKHATDIDVLRQLLLMKWNRLSNADAEALIASCFFLLFLRFHLVLFSKLFPHAECQNALE